MEKLTAQQIAALQKFDEMMKNEVIPSVLKDCDDRYRAQIRQAIDDAYTPGGVKAAYTVLLEDIAKLEQKIKEINEAWRNIQVEEMGYTLREVEALGIDFQKEVVSDGKALHDVVMKRIAVLRQAEQKAADVDRLALPWTTKKPDKPGWYWWRVRYKTGAEDGYIERIYKVQIDDSGAFVSGIGSVDTLDGQWAGPIAEPLPMEGGGR